MFGVMAGLIIVPLNEGLALDNASLMILVGLSFSFGSTLFYAMLYVHVERSLQPSGLHASCDPITLVFSQSLLACSLLLFAFVFCRFYLEAFDPPEPGFSFYSITFPAILMITSSASHSYSWLRLLECSGATGTGLLQG